MDLLSIGLGIVIGVSGTLLFLLPAWAFLDD